MKENVGIQDQCAAAYGGLVYIEADKESIRPRKFVTRKEYINYICENTLLGFDGKERFSGICSAKTKTSIKRKTNIPFFNFLPLINIS